MVLTRRLIVMVLLLLALLPVAVAQVEVDMEQWVEETGSDESAADLSDQLLQLADNPVNLNDTVAIADLPFLSPFQIRALKTYITLYGQLLSIKELTVVPGFDSAMVALLAPLVTVEPYEPARRLTLKELLSRGRHTVVAGVGGTVEQAQGYANGHYEGDNLRALLCYSYQLDDRVSVRLSADKDPMEAWGKGNFYGYHVMLKHMGRLETLIVGRYNLQFGQGVTLWTGFHPFSLLGTSPVRYGQGVRAASAFYETGWQEGVAATLSLGRGYSLSAFGSRHDGEWFGGGHLTWSKGNLMLGITATATMLDDSVQLRDYAYNQDYFRGDRQAALGVDFLWQRDRLLFYGEASLDQGGAPAALGGIRLSVGGDNSLGVGIRHYDPQYHNLHAGSYAIGETRNEQGVTLDARLRLPLAVTALLSVDVHRFPSLRYGSYAPSSGTWLRAQLSREFGRHVTASLRYSWRQKYRNIPNLDSTLYLGESTCRRQLQGQARLILGSWQLTTRVLLSQFDAEQSEGEWGWLVAQEARYAVKDMQVALQAAWFDVDGYNARIYLSESNLQYAYSIPMLMNSGLRASAVVRWDVSRRLNLSFKYTLTAYQDVAAIGSGDAQTDGNHRQTWHLQLRWKF